jgi:hypothetical protein
MRKILNREVGVAVVALGLVAAISGCLVSGTKVFTYGLDDINVNAASYTVTSVDLTTNSTFNDHIDDIKLIDRFGFTCNVVNTGGPANTISVYFSTNPNIPGPDVPTQATALFRDFAVPADGIEPITYDESVALIENFEALQAAVETGNLTFYSIASQAFNLTIDDPVLVVTFTVGL